MLKWNLNTVRFVIEVKVRPSEPVDVILAFFENFFVSCSDVAKERISDGMYQLVAVSFLSNIIGAFRDFMVKRIQQILPNEKSQLRTTSNTFTSLEFSNAVELHTVVWKPHTDIVGPVLKFLSRPLKLVVVMSEGSFWHVEDDVELSVWCRDDRNLWFDESEYVVWNVFKYIREEVLDAAIKGF